MKKNKWIEKNIDRLDGKRVVITGATGGLGKVICFSLAHLGAKITIACRNRDKANDLILEIQKQYPECDMDFVELDLNSLESVNRFVDAIKNYNGIDILINNAGIYNVPLKTLDSGFNNIFQVNFVYTYYLTKELLGELEKKPNSVCVTMGSVAHNYSKSNFDDIDFSGAKKPSRIYGNSKRFLMFSLFELFKNKKTRLSIVHPGVTLTNMTNHYPKAINWLVKLGIKLFFPSPQKAGRSVFAGIEGNTPYHTWIGPRFFDVWGAPRMTALKTCSAEESLHIFSVAEEIYNKLKEK